MRCPYCRTGLLEESVECPACRLTLDRASSLLGPVPRTNTGIGDNAGLLTPRETARIGRAIRRLEWTFPQVDFHLLTHFFPQDHPFELNVFWFFNCGGHSGEHTKGGANHGILLAIDPDQGKSALMVGYGLEPFLADEALDRILEHVAPSWKTGLWEKGILGTIAGLEQLLERAATEATEAFGLAAENPGAKEEGVY